MLGYDRGSSWEPNYVNNCHRNSGCTVYCCPMCWWHIDGTIHPSNFMTPSNIIHFAQKVNYIVGNVVKLYSDILDKCILYKSFFFFFATFLECTEYFSNHVSFLSFCSIRSPLFSLSLFPQSEFGLVSPHREAQFKLSYSLRVKIWKIDLPQTIGIKKAFRRDYFGGLISVHKVS